MISTRSEVLVIRSVISLTLAFVRDPVRSVQGQYQSAEKIIAKLRFVEVQLAQGKSLALACKEAEISEQTSKTSACSGRSSTACVRRRW